MIRAISMLRERNAPQSEVIRAIVLGDSPCCGGPGTGVAKLALFRPAPSCALAWMESSCRPPSPKLFLRPPWLTAAIPLDNPYCSCKLTRLQLQSLWMIPTAAVSTHSWKFPAGSSKPLR